MSGRDRLARVAAYFGLAVALTWPLALHPAALLAGGARTDAPNALWNFWFVHEALARGALPMATEWLNHPVGGRIVVADPLNCLLAFPLVHLVGEVPAYAFLVVGHLCFAGLAAHALGVRLGGKGWVAGVGYASAPILLSHIHNGSSEAISAGWLPLAAWAAVVAVERGGAGRAIRAGLALAVCAIGGWYAGVGAFGFVAALAVAGWRGVARRDVFVRAGAAILVGAALAAPVALAVTSVARAPDGLVEIKNAEDLARIRRTLGPADPRTFVLPGDFRAPDFATLPANPSDRVHTAYLGWTLLALAALHGRRAALWIALAGGLLIAMGPVLTVDGYPISLAGRGLPLPYLVVEDLPGFSSLSLLYRLATVSALMLALLADRARPLWALLVLFEVRALSPARDLPAIGSPPVSTAASTLGTLEAGAVINLPVSAGRNYLFEQTLHQKPIAGSLNSGVNLAGLKVLHALRRLRVGEIDKPEAVAVAKTEGVRYVVLHKNVLMAEAFVAASTAVRTHWVPVAEDERLLVVALW